jgi:hypothetical protein
MLLLLLLLARRLFFCTHTVAQQVLQRRIVAAERRQLPLRLSFARVADRLPKFYSVVHGATIVAHARGGKVVVLRTP